jgi:hypothetical protein
MVDVGRSRRWKTLGWGLALGIAILIPLTIVQTMWINANPGLVEKLFSGNLMPPSQ